MVVIGDVLYNFVSFPFRLYDFQNGTSTDALASRYILPRHAALYAIRLSGCACILVVFTAICLGFAGKGGVIPGEPLQEQAGRKYSHRKRYNVVGECLWAVGLAALVVLIALADWYLFLRSNFLGYVIWPY